MRLTRHHPPLPSAPCRARREPRVACSARRDARIERRRGRAKAVAIVVPLACALAGCATMNASDGLIDAEPGALPDLRGEPRPALPESSGEASLRGLDRRHWPVVVVREPAGQVEHQPYYFEPVDLASGTARGEGLDPTPATVLEGASDGGSLLLEAAAAPFVFVGELVILPVRAIFDPPWAVHRSPATISGAPSIPAAPGQPAVSGDAAVDWRWVGGQE